PVQDDPKRRQLTLEGSPMVEDLERGKCTASQKIVATLVDDAYKTSDPAVQAARYRPDQTEEAAKPASSDEPESKLRIELIRAWRDVELVTGASKAETPKKAEGGMPGADAPKTIKAREMLVAHFEPEAPPAVSTTPAPQPEPAPAPAVAANPQPEVSPEKPKEPKPPEPPLEIEAERIWAWLGTVPSPTGQPKSDVKEARLRGQVLVHQDPKPGKPKGMDVNGDQVDLIRQVVPDPSAPEQEARLFEVRAYGAPGEFAYVGTDSFSIEGRALGLDQSKNYAVVMGPGRLIQDKAGGEILGDGPTIAVKTEKPKTPEDPMKPKGPLTITWGLDDDGRILTTEQGGPLETWMRFYGRPLDDNGQPGPAKAYFYNHVHGFTDESDLHCGQMIAYLDREIDFRKAIKKPEKSPGTPEGEAEPMARVTNVVCEQNVDISSIKRFETGEVRQRQRVLGEVVTYDKEANEFHVESPGTVYLYDRKKAEPTPATARTRAKPAPKAPPLEPLELTRIDFDRRMDGQLNSRLPGSKSQLGVA
ncbi:MAG TPA: hypothetical protein VFT74_01790, partial [Isosphaeraceae bacterium]|nr:hypothetical protein [Isosphaeraceae bacterium]